MRRPNKERVEAMVEALRLLAWGYSRQEIGDHLGVTTVTIHNWIKRSKLPQFARTLKEHGLELPAPPTPNTELDMFGVPLPPPPRPPLSKHPGKIKAAPQLPEEVRHPKLLVACTDAARQALATLSGILQDPTTDKATLISAANSITSLLTASIKMEQSVASLNPTKPNLTIVQPTRV